MALSRRFSDPTSQESCIIVTAKPFFGDVLGINCPAQASRQCLVFRGGHVLHGLCVKCGTNKQRGGMQSQWKGMCWKCSANSGGHVQRLCVKCGTTKQIGGMQSQWKGMCWKVLKEFRRINRVDNLELQSALPFSAATGAVVEGFSTVLAIRTPVIDRVCCPRASKRMPHAMRTMYMYEHVRRVHLVLRPVPAPSMSGAPAALYQLNDCAKP